MNYVSFALNHNYNSTIQNVHVNTATGSTCDVSHLISFHFWQSVHFKSYGSILPSYSIEETGRFVGINENVGHAMTFSNLNSTTNRVISISNFRVVGEPTSPNLRIDPLTVPEVVTSRNPHSDYLEDKGDAPTVTEE